MSAVFGMLLLATAAVGCTTVIEGAEPPAMEESGESTTVRVNFAEGTEIAGARLAGKGTLASAAKVVISRLGADGKLTEIATADIDPSGGIEVPIANTGSPGEILVLQVESISGAILGSTVLNGIPAFFKGFLIDVPLDTATSFKTEILMTMANGGVPGVQNYLNVVNAFVDAELAGNIAVFNAFVLDFNSIFGAFANASIATQSLINEQLEAAGLPIDADAIASSQMMALAGLQGTITTGAGNVVTNTKNLIAELQAATAGAAAPVDKAIFDALVGGDAMFKSTFNAKMAAKPSTAGYQQAFAFPLVKAGFKLESEVARDRIVLLFKQAGVGGDEMAMIDAADATFAARVAQAKDVQALAAAKTAYKETLFGQESSMQGSLVAELATVLTNLLATMNNVKATLDPLRGNLETALSGTNLTAAGIRDALARFDAGAKDISAKLETVTTDQNANALAEALKATEKVVLP